MNWLPFYFSRIGFGYESSIVAVAFFITLTFGLFPLEFLFSFCEHLSEFFIAMMLILNSGILFLMTQLS